MIFRCWRRSVFNECQSCVLIGRTIPHTSIAQHNNTAIVRPSLISVHLQFHRWNSIRLRSCEFPWAAAGPAHGRGSAHSSQLGIFAISQVFTPVAGGGRYDRAISLRGNAMFLPVWTRMGEGRGVSRPAKVFSDLCEQILAAFCLQIFHCTIWTAKRFNAMRWSIITDNLTQLCTHRDPIQLSNRPYFSKPIK